MGIYYLAGVLDTEKDLKLLDYSNYIQWNYI
jgi:hypothetical protein